MYAERNMLSRKVQRDKMRGVLSEEEQKEEEERYKKGKTILRNASIVRLEEEEAKLLDSITTKPGYFKYVGDLEG